MKNNSNSILQIVFFAFFSLVVFNSCSDDPVTIEPEQKIAEDFNIVGKWYFQKVSGVGELIGSMVEDEDNNPQGFINFNEDGTGYSEFGLTLLNNSIVDNQQIRWERKSFDEICIIEEDDVVEEWKLIRANENLIEASWEIRVAEGVATLTAILTP